MCAYLCFFISIRSGSFMSTLTRGPKKMWEDVNYYEVNQQEFDSLSAPDALIHHMGMLQSVRCVLYISPHIEKLDVDVFTRDVHPSIVFQNKGFNYNIDYIQTEGNYLAPTAMFETWRCIVCLHPTKARWMNKKKSFTNSKTDLSLQYCLIGTDRD